MAVPLYDDDAKRELLVVPGWLEDDGRGQFREVVTVVDIGSGARVLHHFVPEAPRAMAAGSTGLVAVAGGPTWDRWTKHKDSPFYNLPDECYVHFLDKSGVRGEWRPGTFVTGPLAIGAAGDLLVPVLGELMSVE